MPLCSHARKKHGVCAKPGARIPVATYVLVSVICSIGAPFAGLHVMRRNLRAGDLNWTATTSA